MVVMRKRVCYDMSVDTTIFDKSIARCSGLDIDIEDMIYDIILLVTYMRDILHSNDVTLSTVKQLKTLVSVSEDALKIAITKLAKRESERYLNRANP